MCVCLSLWSYGRENSVNNSSFARQISASADQSSDTTQTNMEWSSLISVLGSETGRQFELAIQLDTNTPSSSNASNTNAVNQPATAHTEVAIPIPSSASNNANGDITATTTTTTTTATTTANNSGPAATTQNQDTNAAFMPTISRVDGQLIIKWLERSLPYLLLLLIVFIYQHRYGKYELGSCYDLMAKWFSRIIIYLTADGSWRHCSVIVA